MPVFLSASQFSAIANAAAALNPSDRESFIQAVAGELEGKPIGDGSVGRAIRDVQARFPHPAVEPMPPRWARERPRFEKTSRRAF
jgi:hypothetical protein